VLTNTFGAAITIKNSNRLSFKNFKVSVPFVKVFIIRGIGYQVDIVEVSPTVEFPFSRYLSLRLGHSSLICKPIPNYIGVKIAHKDRKLVIYGASKEHVSNFAVKIFKLRPPSVYTGRGIRIKKGLHRRKLGKKDIRKGKV
jgi:large subunit ribosomal protein L6